MIWPVLDLPARKLSQGAPLSAHRDRAAHLIKAKDREQARSLDLFALFHREHARP